MFNLTENLIYTIIYMGIIIGTWLIIYPFFSHIITKRRISKRFRDMIERNINKNKRNQIIRHLEMLLSVTIGTKSLYALLSFFLISSTLFILSSLFLFNTGNVTFLNLFISFGLAISPYIFLQIKLHNIRINASYEAEAVITELINQYKMNYLNMIEAIDSTIPGLKKQPHSKKALFHLSLAIKQYRNNEELEDIIQEFNFAINTDWAMLLSNNLYLSIEYGDDVREALDDILEDLIDLKNINEKNKQYNNETFLLIKYISPGTYLLSVYSMFYIFGFTTEKFLEYQFKNPLGYKFFVLTAISMVINFLIYLFIKKPKNDF